MGTWILDRDVGPSYYRRTVFCTPAATGPAPGPVGHFSATGPDPGPVAEKTFYTEPWLRDV